MLDDIRRVTDDAGNQLSACWHLDTFPHEPLMFVSRISHFNVVGAGFHLEDKIDDATEIRDLRATGSDRACAQGGDTAAERVQNVNRQLLARLRREIGERGASGIFGEGFDLGQGE